MQIKPMYGLLGGAAGKDGHLGSVRYTSRSLQLAMLRRNNL